MRFIENSAVGYYFGPPCMFYNRSLKLVKLIVSVSICTSRLYIHVKQQRNCMCRFT